jgi:hypothetical protein
VFEGAAAIADSRIPLAERDRCRIQLPDRPACPPKVTQGLEGGQGFFARLDRFAQPSKDEVDLGQAGLGKRSDFVQTTGRCNRQRLPAVIDGNIRLAARQAMQKAAPVMPDGAAVGVVALIDEIVDLIESLDVLGVLAEGEF